MIYLLTYKIVSFCKKAYYFLLYNPISLILLVGLILFMILYFGSCNPAPPKPTIDIDGIQRKTTEVQDKADQKLADQLSNINQRLDATKRQPSPKKNVTKEELENILK